MSEDRPARAVTGLARLSRLPRLPVFLGTLAVALAAFFSPGIVGAVLVGLVAALTAALAVTTWSHRTPGERAMPLLVFAVLVAIAVSKLS